MSCTPKRHYPLWQRRHNAVLIYFLANPTATRDECARATRYSRTHVSRICNSEEFKKRYRAAFDAVRSEVARNVVMGTLTQRS